MYTRKTCIHIVIEMSEILLPTLLSLTWSCFVTYAIWYFKGAKHHTLHVYTLRNLLRAVLRKTFFELVAMGTGVCGIAYTLQEVSTRALVMHTLSVIAAITALIIGVENLRFSKTHNLPKRAMLSTGLGIIISIAILVWYFGFH